MLVLVYNNFTVNLFLKIFKTNDKNFEILIKKNPYYLKDKIKKMIFPLFSEKIKDKNLEYILEYQFSAVIGVFSAWCNNNKNLKEEDIINLIYSLSKNGVFQILNSYNDNFKITKKDFSLIESFIKEQN